MTCRFHPGRPAVAVIETDTHVPLTRRRHGTEEIPVCAACLKRWRMTVALKAGAREAVDGPSKVG